MSSGRALVVGVPGGALRGVEYDARAMAALLEARGFVVDLRIGATRTSLIEGYQSLIVSAVRDEPAVFYFAGHGFRGELEDAPGSTWQGLVPSDLSESTTEDFRGITSCELSILQKRLTERTRNVTTILDCCFASQMSRALVGAGAVRSLPHPVRCGFSAHVDALRERYGAVVDELDPVGNPNAIRIAACGPWQCASEARWPDGSPGGALTIALAALLSEIGDVAVSWAMLGDALRHRVQRRWPTQRPEIEGPVRRELFSLREVRNEAIGVVLHGDGARLHAGRVAGITVGDVYGVMPLDACCYSSTNALSTLRIHAVRAMSSDGVLTPSSQTYVREALAFAIEKAVALRSIALSGSEEEIDLLASSIARVPGLLPLTIEAPEVLARVQVTASEILIDDAYGRVCEPFMFPSEIQDAVAQLAQLAIAQSVRELEGAHGVTDAEIKLSWGTIENGEMRALPRHGCTLGMADRPYIRISNISTRRLYVHVLGLGLRGEISLLTSDAPSGVELRRDRPDFILGQGPDGKLRGIALSWPPGAPRNAGPRLDELIVVVAATRGNLHTLSNSSGRRSRLSNALAQRRTVVCADSPSQDAMWIGRISFGLDPCTNRVVRDAW